MCGKTNFWAPLNVSLSQFGPDVAFRLVAGLKQEGGEMAAEDIHVRSE